MKTAFEMNYFMTFGFCGACIFVGVLLRARLAFLQRFLVPSCVIVGLVGIWLLNLGLITLSRELFQV